MLNSSLPLLRHLLLVPFLFFFIYVILSVLALFLSVVDVIQLLRIVVQLYALLKTYHRQGQGVRNCRLACRSTGVIRSKIWIFLTQRLVSFILRSSPYLVLDLHRSDIYQ